MDEKSIRIIPFSGKREKWRMRSGKFMARARIKGNSTLLADDAEILADNADEKKTTE